MLELRLLDLVSLIRVAADAEVFHLCLRQNDFSVLGRFMADLAELFAERRMHECLHQLGLHRLVRIVTGNAISFSERLPFMGLDQALVIRIVTVEAKRWRGLGEMKRELGVRLVPRLVRDVTGVASQIESIVPASTLGRIQACLVTGEAEVLGRCSAGTGLQ